MLSSSVSLCMSARQPSVVLPELSAKDPAHTQSSFQANARPGNRQALLRLDACTCPRLVSSLWNKSNNGLCGLEPQLCAIGPDCTDGEPYNAASLTRSRTPRALWAALPPSAGDAPQSTLCRREACEVGGPKG